ncbi:tetratricopeptide repeat protein [Rhodocaloribacter litoris]|uniref:tetratricopeptide repeat protein n=1 Tax=Rhodocaloribacter litoris TaxID=2558931 RepID=UPI00141F92CA|nr:tetratricopeptide repeat protein [Rhodocaloribacter litoris]QXD16746.1 tetratricopeptide repeat protein [Rhodocaloribacter litoris]
MQRFVLLSLIVVGLAGCGGQEEAAPGSPAGSSGEAVRFRNVEAGVAFVGDAVCASCHEAEYHGYQAHGMARSWYRLTPENAVETFPSPPIYHAGRGYYYRAFEEAGRFYQEEYRLGPDGEKTHRLVREMHHVVGSGTAARTYLTENNGYLYELPLTWYTQTGRWDFSPGYREDNPRFDRLIPDRCVACHNSYPVSVPFVEGKYERMPEGIGCERCHGPGDLHVEVRLADPEVVGDYDPTIVNPAHLPFERRLDVCQQCHLSGTVSILRERRSAFDFRPSEPLSAHVSLFYREEPTRVDRIDVISHADRMKKSACFQATLAQGNPMECITCHNPHEGFRDKGPAYFNTTCQDCHAPAALVERFDTPAARERHTPEANCIACHMPKVAGEGTPHTTFTDHLIRVVRDEPAPSPEPVHRPPVLKPYFERDAGGTDGLRYAGMAYVVYGTQRGDTLALREGIRRLARALAEDPEHGEAQYLLGFARLRLGEVGEAIPPLETAVRLDPGVPERLNTLAQAYEADGRDPAVIARLYRRALDLQPALAGIRVNYGRFLEAQGRLQEAVALYRQAIEEQPWLVRAHYNLGSALLRDGDMEAGEAALRRALELNPDDPDALTNMGLAHILRGAREAARPYLERAVAVAPSHPIALGNLGAFYLEEDRLDRAIDLLTRAVEVRPDYVDALANLALAHFRHDDMEAAARYARRALELAPGHPLARQILAAL